MGFLDDENAKSDFFFRQSCLFGSLVGNLVMVSFSTHTLKGQHATKEREDSCK